MLRWQNLVSHCPIFMQIPVFQGKSVLECSLFSGEALNCRVVCRSTLQGWDDLEQGCKGKVKALCETNGKWKRIYSSELYFQGGGHWPHGVIWIHIDWNEIPSNLSFLVPFQELSAHLWLMVPSLSSTDAERLGHDRKLYTMVLL